MVDERLIGPRRIQRRLAELATRQPNFDPAALPWSTALPRSAALRRSTARGGWRIDDLCQLLPGEPAGLPVRGGSWETAQSLIRSYEFADPSIVRAYYDPATPLEHRDMLLRLRALALVQIYVGVRVGAVADEQREIAGRQVRVWGWNYRTLEGHVEMGQMDWQVWKWLDSGEVQFRVHSVSRPAPIPNPLVRIGFRVLRNHERRLFLESTMRRMRRFTELGLDHEHGAALIQSAAAQLTAHRLPEGDPAPGRLARNVGRDELSS